MKLKSGICELLAGLTLCSTLSAQPDRNIEQISRTYNQWIEGVQDIEIFDERAFLAAGIAGLQVVDISNPRSPRVSGYWDDDQHNCVNLTVAGNIAILALRTPMLVFLDINDPDHPSLIGSMPTRQPVRKICSIDDYLYIAEGDSGFSVVAFGDPAHARMVWNSPKGGHYRNILQAGDIAFVGNNDIGLLAFDISDRVHPRRVGTLSSRGSFDELKLVGELMYIADDWNGLKIVDVSNPEEMSLLYKSPEVEASSWGIEIANGYAYLANYINDFDIVDVSNPRNPQPVGHLDAEGRPIGLALQGNSVYLVEADGGLVSVDVSNPANPRTLATLGVDWTILGMAVEDNRLYFSDSESGLRVVDISDLANPQEASRWQADHYAIMIAVREGYAYFPINNEGIATIDYRNLQSPTQVGYAEYRRYMKDIELQGDYAYIGGYGIQVFDISDVRRPSMITDHYLSNVDDLEFQGDYALAAATGLEIVDISNPHNLETVKTMADIGETAWIAVEENRAYLTVGFDGFRVVDISDPRNPVVLGSNNQYRYLDDIAVQNGFVVISDQERGIRVIDARNPANMRETGYFNTPGFAENMVLLPNGKLILNDGTNLGIYDISEALTAPSATEEQPTRFILLHPSFPNPFNSSTTISYDIARPGFVRLGVFDQSGRLVETLREEWSRPGKYRAVWNGQEAPSGNYFVRLDASATNRGATGSKEETITTAITLQK